MGLKEQLAAQHREEMQRLHNIEDEIRQKEIRENERRQYSNNSKTTLSSPSFFELLPGLKKIIPGLIIFLILFGFFSNIILYIIGIFLR